MLMTWERLARRGPMVGSPCTASSANTAPSSRGGRKACEHWEDCFRNPLLWVCHSLPLVSISRVWDRFGGKKDFPAWSLGLVWQASCGQCCEIQSGFFFPCDTDLTLPALFLPSSSSSQLCLTLNSCLKSLNFPQPSVTDLRVLITITASKDSSMQSSLSTVKHRHITEKEIT